MNKICVSCGIEKEETDFQLLNNSWRRNSCINCENKKKLDRFYKNHEQNKLKAKEYGRTRKNDIRRKSNIKIKYGVTEEWYNETLALQNGCCKICNKTVDQNKRKLSIDHNHTTGKVRGLLCSDCNFTIGFARDSITTLSRAVDYLKCYDTFTD